jgi:hypothetical protein
MKKHSFALLAALIGVLALGVSAAVSQEDMKIIKSEAFKSHTRPPAVFVHDAHNEKAKIDKTEDCGLCHHGKDKSGKLDKKVTSEGTPCAECHAVDASEGTPLKRAYHQQCIHCHVEKKLGPTYCGGCHKR